MMEPKKKRGNIQNLKTPSAEEARKLGRSGGKKSVQVRREKKLLSQIYGEILAKGFEVGGEKLPLESVVGAVMARCDASSVSMLKEIREATEGSKIRVDAELSTPVPFVFVDPPNKPE